MKAEIKEKNVKVNVSEKYKAINKLESEGKYEEAKKEREKLKKSGNYLVD